MNQPLRLGIAGLGTVGVGLLQLLREHGPRLADNTGRSLEVVGVSARTRAKKRAVSLEGITWFDEAERLAADPSIDVFVELIGGDGIARTAVEAALNAGKHVVTANKALLAAHGYELAKLAEKSGVALNFEAAVAGGIPIIKTLREALAANQIRRVYGILNGTCNYILTQMQEREPLVRRRAGGGAGAGLCRGRPHLRHRRLRHRAQALPADEPRLRHPRRLRSDRRGGHRDHHARPTSRRRTIWASASSCSAWP